MKQLKNQKGFTLVEIAIVLVIIGLLLGGVLKGQEMIYNAKVKNVQSQLKEMSAAYYTYMDKYKALPGDDAAASSRWTGAPNGGGNGGIAGGYCDTAAEESCYLWRHLRYANIISGNAADAVPATMVPKHAFGGNLNMFNGTYAIGGLNQSGLWITLQNMESVGAEAIDRQIDDGQCTTGSMARYAGTACDADGTYPAAGYLDVWIKY